MTLSSGGHPLPMVPEGERADGNRGRRRHLVGAFSDPDLADSTVELEPGDSLLLYTDGALSERGGSVPGERVLRNVFSACGGLSALEIAAKPEMEMAAHEGPAPADDTAFLVFRIV